MYCKVILYNEISAKFGFQVIWDLATNGHRWNKSLITELTKIWIIMLDQQTFRENQKVSLRWENRENNYTLRQFISGLLATVKIISISKKLISNLFEINAGA